MLSALAAAAALGAHGLPTTEQVVPIQLDIARADQEGQPGRQTAVQAPVESAPNLAQMHIRIVIPHVPAPAGETSDPAPSVTGDQAQPSASSSPDPVTTSLATATPTPSSSEASQGKPSDAAQTSASSATAPGNAEVSAAGENASGLPFGLGVFGHSKDRIEQFQRVVGRKVDVVTVAPARETWNDILNEDWWLTTAPDGFEGNLDVALPLFPESSSMAETASGANNDEFEATGAKIAQVDPEGYVRTGWEMNIVNWPWRVTEGNVGEYVEAFRQQAVSLRKGGPNLRIVWNPNGGVGNSLADATKAYPGDEYVDVIGIDQYDWAGESWEQVQKGPGGLDEWANFARAHGKKMALPEWGVHQGDGGGGDDGEFVRSMMTWLEQNSDVIVYAAYFDEPDSSVSNSIAQGQAPQAAQAMIDSANQIAR